MVQHMTRNPFEPGGPNYRALWEADIAWGVIGLAIVLFALAAWAFVAFGGYHPTIEAPRDVPAVESRPLAPATPPLDTPAP